MPGTADTLAGFRCTTLLGVGGGGGGGAAAALQLRVVMGMRAAASLKIGR